MSHTRPKCFKQSGIYILDEIGVAVWYDGVVTRIVREQREALRPRDQVINKAWQAVMSDSPAITEE